MNNCFSIYHTSWITSGPKNNFICESVPTKAILFFFGCSQANSTFRARWLASSGAPSAIHLRAAEEKQNGLCRHIVTNKVTLWAASYSACVVYTKTIIHLSVGESGVYLPPLRWIIVNYCEFWKHVLLWLWNNNINVGGLREAEFIFGKFDEIQDDFTLINHILLLGKYYIYSRKCQNAKPSLEELHHDETVRL